MSPQLEQFMQAMFGKAAFVLILCAVAGVFIALPLYWLRIKLERTLIEKVRSARLRREAQKNARSTAASDLEPLQLEDSPHCPVCNSLMVKRTARRGTGAGSQFWGCSNYPKCRGTRPI